MLQVPQKIWLSNVWNASLLKQILSSIEATSDYNGKTAQETYKTLRWETMSEHNKLSKQKAKWTTPHEYQQHNKTCVCICTPFTFYNVLMIISSFTMTHLKTGPQQRT